MGTETAPDTGAQDGFETAETNSDQEIPADWQTVSRSQHALPCLEKINQNMQQQQSMPITPGRNIVVTGH